MIWHLSYCPADGFPAAVPGKASIPGRRAGRGPRASGGVEGWTCQLGDGPGPGRGQSRTRKHPESRVGPGVGQAGLPVLQDYIHLK
eukprot:768664-Hanusia_phi.AAC.4